jgi:hypothetical protein
MRYVIMLAFLVINVVLHELNRHQKACERAGEREMEQLLPMSEAEFQAVCTTSVAEYALEHVTDVCIAI